MDVTKVDWEDLRRRMRQYDYPENHSFDPEKLEPTGKSYNRFYVISDRFEELSKRNYGSLLDIGCNRGLFSFFFKDNYHRIIAIDPMPEMINLARDIKKAHGINHIQFLCCRFERYDSSETFDVVHFGQCSHYLFRDGFRSGGDPLWFLGKVKGMTNKYIAIDSGFDGDPSVEYDFKHDKWPPLVKQMATIEGYAQRLRPEFRLIRYNHSGDGATRYMAIFERI